jgi:hypothetical protein
LEELKNTKKEKDKYKNIVVPQHEFRPATFVTVTGRSSEDLADIIPEDKMDIIKN